MSKKLENIFNECLERILRGESVEDCLKSYPKEANKLESLLRIASLIHKDATLVRPRSSFKEQTRLNLRGAFLYARRQRQPRPKTGISLWDWQRRWAWAVAIILIVLVISASTTAASAQALPGEPLYSVKLASEQVRLALAFSNISKAELQAQFAEVRAAEIAALVRQGKTAHITKTAQRLTNHLEKTEYYAAMIMPVKPETKEAPPLPLPTAPALSVPQTAELKKRIEERVPRSIAILEQALAHAPDEVKSTLHQTVEMHKEKYQKILQKMEEAPPSTPVKPEPKQKGIPHK